MRILLVHPGAFYATADVWSGLRDGLLKNGHTVVEYDLGVRLKIAHDALQLAWEMGHETTAARGRRPDWPMELYHAGHAVYSTALRHDIEAVIIVTAQFWHPDHTILLRKAGLAVGVVMTESPYLDEEMAPNVTLANIVWTNERTSVPRLRTAARALHGDHTAVVKYLPTAYNPLRHGTEGVEAYAWEEYADVYPSHDVVMVGSGFRERVSFLESVDWSGVDLGLYGDWVNVLPEWTPEGVTRWPIWAQRLWTRLPGGSPLGAHVRGGVISGDRAAALYVKAKVGLNMWRESKSYRQEVSSLARTAESLSPRVYELAALGCPFVSEPRAELADVFGDLIPTFTTPEELRSRVVEMVGDESRRREVSMAIREAVRGHTYVHRADQLTRDLMDLMRAHGVARYVDSQPTAAAHTEPSAIAIT